MLPAMSISLAKPSRTVRAVEPQYGHFDGPASVGSVSGRVVPYREHSVIRPVTRAMSLLCRSPGTEAMPLQTVGYLPV
jgi:hypothetical protein